MIKIKQHKESLKWNSLEVKRGKLTQRANLREKGIKSWAYAQLAAKGI